MRIVSEPLLAQTDAAPFLLLNAEHDSALVFCCDHAGAQIPARLGDLGLSAADLRDHIAIDVGIFATTSWIAAMMDAPLVAQPFSRLVIDCNRQPGTGNSIPEQSDGRIVAGNAELTQAEKDLRAVEILLPYQARLATCLQNRTKTLGHPPVLVAMHSFARKFNGKDRVVDIGVIYEGYSEFGDILLGFLTAGTDLRVDRNTPYRIDFEGDYTLPVHTKGGTLPFVEIEICQDLISTCDGQRRLADIFVPALRKTLQAMKNPDGSTS